MSKYTIMNGQRVDSTGRYYVIGLPKEHNKKNGNRSISKDCLDEFDKDFLVEFEDPETGQPYIHPKVMSRSYVRDHAREFGHKFSSNDPNGANPVSGVQKEPGNGFYVIFRTWIDNFFAEPPKKKNDKNSEGRKPAGALF